MTTHEFIQKAIDGGWIPPSDLGDSYTIEDWGIRHSYCEYIHNQVILLDPLAWQAVGKVEGWDEQELTVDYGDGHNPWDTNWKFNMHRMIDVLCKGKSIEEFLETL